MNNLESVCRKVLNSIDGILSVLIINLENGNIMADSFLKNENIQELKNNISDVVMEILRSSAANRVKSFLSKQKGEEIKNIFKETFINSRNSFYFIKTIDDNDVAIFIMSEKMSNQGLIWAEIKESIPLIKEIIS